MRVTITALRREGRKVIRQVVESRHPVEITQRGRVVAVISPAPGLVGLERLRALGHVIPRDPSALARGLAAPETLPPVRLMEALEEQRDTER